MPSGMAKRSLTTSMANEYVLDTHTLIWYLEGNPRLSAKAKTPMDDPASILYLPIIALAEACWIVERNKCAIPSVNNLTTDVDCDARIITIPLDRTILDLSCSLTAINEMHDRLIVATAIHLGGSSKSLPLISCDGNITVSGLVPVVW